MMVYFFQTFTFGTVPWCYVYQVNSLVDPTDTREMAVKVFVYVTNVRTGQISQNGVELPMTFAAARSLWQTTRLDYQDTVGGRGTGPAPVEPGQTP